MAKQLIKYEEIECENGNQVARARFENGHTITFLWDEDTESPRNLEPVGTMCMWHSRYNLPCEGTWKYEPNREDFENWCRDGDMLGMVSKNCSGYEAVDRFGVEWFMMWGDCYLDFCKGWKTEKWQNRLVKRAMSYINKNYVWSLVGMYDHSGLSFSHVSSYKYDDWDCGVVGCHYVSMEKLAKELLGMTKAQRIVAANDHLKAELNVYDLWQRGSVVWFKIEDAEGNDMDSCGGYITDETDLDKLIELVSDNFSPCYFVDEEKGNNNE